MLTNSDIFCYITYFIVLFLLISNSKYTTVFFMITALSFMSCFYNNTSAIIICGIILTISYDLIYDTVEGAFQLAKKENNTRNLIKSVSSKKGTTEAALKVLENKNTGLYKLMRDAVHAAKKRANSLSDLS